MDPENENKGVKDVERVEITPTKDGENVESETEKPEPESPQEETEGDDAEDEESEGDDKPDEIVTRQTAPAGSKEPEEEGEPAAVPGETPRERALRLEVTRLRGEKRGDRIQEVLPRQTPATATPELSEDEKKVLGKYKPEELGALREVLPVLAKQMGFVKKDEIAGSTYTDKAQTSLDGFLEKHPEYLPENDKDGTLWDAFKAEYGLYKQPTDPKDFPKIFERVHRDVFGIKPPSGLNKTKTARERTSAASHAGASSAPTAPPAKRANPSGLRLDMLKGFTSEELAELGDE